MNIPFVGEVSLAVVASTGLVAILLASWFLKLETFKAPSRGTSRTIPANKNEFTLAEVAQFDGKGPEDEPILTVIDGLVYNLQTGREFYGQGGPYHPFAGRDCSRLLAKNQVSDKSDSGEPLTETELEQLEKWKEFFNNKYKSIGTVV